MQTDGHREVLFAKASVLCVYAFILLLFTLFLNLYKTIVKVKTNDGILFGEFSFPKIVKRKKKRF